MFQLYSRREVIIHTEAVWELLRGDHKKDSTWNKLVFIGLKVFRLIGSLDLKRCFTVCGLTAVRNVNKDRWLEVQYHFIKGCPWLWEKTENELIDKALSIWLVKCSLVQNKL